MLDWGLFGIVGLYEIWKDICKQLFCICMMLMIGVNMVIWEFGSKMLVIFLEDEINIWFDFVNIWVMQLLLFFKLYNMIDMNLYFVIFMVVNDEYDCYECVEEMDLKVVYVCNF